MLAEAVLYAQRSAESAPLAPLLQRIGRTQQAWDAAAAALSAPLGDAAAASEPDFEASAAVGTHAAAAGSGSTPERAHSSSPLQQRGQLQGREDGSTRDALLAAQILTAVRHPADFQRWSQGTTARLQF